MRILSFVAAGVALFFGAPSFAQSAPSDGTIKTPAGNSIKAPPEWRDTTSGKMLRFDAPEGDFSLAIVDVGKAADAKAAAQEAWAVFRPDDHHPLKLATPRPGRQGWDERAELEYETSANEHLLIDAFVLRRGDAWTVMIADGSQSTAEKRAGAIGLVVQSLRPAGYTKENFAGRTAHPLDAARIEQMRSFVETSIKELGVPGASFALIDHGKVVYEGGVGVKQLGKPYPVDARTLFMIASNTKGMSTLLLSQLVDQRQLDWNEPVTKVYPAFRLGSAATTASVEMRHLVCACTGLPRKDFDWIFDTRRNTPASVTFTQLAATEPTSKFGEVFQYNNLMASAAGYIAGHLFYPKMELGAAYDRAMQDHIFDPLGMTDSTLSIPRAVAGDYASPHGDDIDGKPAIADMAFNYVMLPYRPAGGAWSSARDLIKYVDLELTQGVLPDGKRLVSAKNLLARRARGVPTGENQWYGMGLEEDATWGVSVIHHGGSMAGYKTDLMLVPDAQVGAVILTNSDDGQMLLRPFQRRLLEVLYDGNPEAASDVAAAARQNQAEIAKERTRLAFPPDPAVTSQLAREYTSPELGHIKVETNGSSTRFVFTAWSSLVASRKNDDGTVSLVTTDPTNNGFEFVVGKAGGHPTLTTRDGQHAYVFAGG